MRNFISIAQEYPLEAKRFKELNGIDPNEVAYYERKAFKYPCARCGEIVLCNINDRKRAMIDGKQRYVKDKEILCKRCSSKQRSLNSKRAFKGMSIAQYLKDDISIKRFIELNNSIDPYSTSISTHDKVKMWCNRCGRVLSKPIVLRDRLKIKKVVNGKVVTLTNYSKDILCANCGGVGVSDRNSLKNNSKKAILLWDYEKNEVKPENIAFGSEKSFWFKCSNGHSFKTTIASVETSSDKFNGCRKCFEESFTKLQNSHPFLEKIYDKKRNTLLFENLATKSNEKVYWLCEKGVHDSYLRIVANQTKDDRYSDGIRCPLCKSSYSRSNIENIVFKHINYLFDNVCKSNVKFSTLFEDINIDKESLYNYINSEINLEIDDKIVESLLEAISNQKYSLKRFEADIVIEDAKIIIEVDGGFYHSKEDGLQKDILKNLIAKLNGYKVIRLRDKRLDVIDKSSDIIIDDNNFRYSDILKLIDKIKETLENSKHPTLLYNHQRYDELVNSDDFLTELRSVEIKPIPYNKSLAARYPEVADMLDEIKSNISANELLCSDNTKVWWKDGKYGVVRKRVEKYNKLRRKEKEG